MNQTRTLLVVALLFVAWLIWNQWQQDYSAQSPQTHAQSAGEQTTAVAPNTGEVPLAGAAPAAATPGENPARIPSVGTPPAAPPRQLVTLSNDVLRLTIDTRGGSIVRADLLKYPQQVKGDSSPVRLLDDSKQRFFIAQDGLVGANGSAAPDHLSLFMPKAANAALAADAKDVSLDLSWRDATGVSVTKRYTLDRGSYVVRLSQRIDNGSTRTWSGNAYEQIERVQPPAPPKHFLEFYDPERSSFL